MQRRDSLLIQQHVFIMDNNAVLLAPPQHNSYCSSSITGCSCGPDEQQQQHDVGTSQPTIPARVPPTTPAQQHLDASEALSGKPAEASQLHSAQAAALVAASRSSNDAAVAAAANTTYGFAAGPLSGISAPWFEAPRACYTVTTWAPIPLLQHMQQQSRKICEAAVAGTMAAAVTIPGGRWERAQHSMQEEDQASTSSHASCATRQLQENGPCLMRAYSALPAQYMAPLQPELEVGAKTVLQYTSAALLQDMQADDMQQQLQQRVLARHYQQLQLQQQRPQHRQPMAYQQQLKHPMMDTAVAPVKRRCFDTCAAALNNLSIRCDGNHNQLSSRCTSSHSDHTAVSSDTGIGMQHTPSCSSNSACGNLVSPSLVNNSNNGHDLSPILTQKATAPSSAPVTQQLQAGNPASKAGHDIAHSTTGHGVSTDSCILTGMPPDPVLQVKQGSRSDWLGPEGADSYWHQQRYSPPTFTFGVQALLTPSGREIAAPDAISDAAYAVAAMHGGMPPDARLKVARQLAVAAVHAARTELLTTAALTGDKHGLVPRTACGYDGQEYRSFTTVGRALPVPLPKPAGNPCPAPTVEDLPTNGAIRAGLDPLQTANGHTTGLQQQEMDVDQDQQATGQALPSTGTETKLPNATNPDTYPGQSAGAAPPPEATVLVVEPQVVQEGVTDQATGWAASNAFAAPAANTNNNWVVGAFGIAGPTCTYWQQHQQDMAQGWEPAAAAAQPVAQSNEVAMLQSARCEQLPADAFGQGYYTQAANGYQGYYGYCQQQEEMPVCPPSPQLEGVDYWSDQCAMVCYSNTWKRTAEEAFGAEDG